MSTPNAPPPDTEDLRGLARSLRLLVEIGVRTLTEDAGPSELALRVTGHLGCELTAVVPVTEKFPIWEHVNIQRGVDAYLAARPGDAEWFGAPADADVTFVLTTNRADILETALADRPGRVDLAVEIPRPDATCRERLLRVYVRDLALDADLAPVVAGTEGVTASFIKEMIRRTVLVSLRAGERPPVLRDAYFARVLTEMNGERHALTRSLLGVGDGGDEPAGAHPSGLAMPVRHRRIR